ncbi:MAG: ferrochelatase [Planctomycetes bacterium]|nr:ferrochelatase [Planctomycetota bacterium]
MAATSVHCAFDAVFLAAFGGPTPGCCKQAEPCPGEARCFVEDVLGRNPARAARVEEVTAHYAHLGGFSPFNRHTDGQVAALGAALRERGIDVPVRAGYRHWRPYIRDGIAALASEGARRVLAVVLAPHQSSISWDWYLKVVAESLDPLGKKAPEVAYLDPWWAQEGFVEACAGRVREALAGWPAARSEKAELIFTAHAIPSAIARTSPYERQFRETSEAVARRLARPFSVAYQSGPDEPTIPWTGPDICDVMRERARPGRDFVLAPVGFLVDNVEILYDLDVAARREAESRGAGFVRAGAVGTHPAFIGMLADRIAARA